MQAPEENTGKVKHSVKDTPTYTGREALEEARLRETMNRSDTEKFRMSTRMMRISQLLKKARITYKPE